MRALKTAGHILTKVPEHPRCSPNVCIAKDLLPAGGCAAKASQRVRLQARHHKITHKQSELLQIISLQDAAPPTAEQPQAQLQLQALFVSPKGCLPPTVKQSSTQLPLRDPEAQGDELLGCHYKKWEHSSGHNQKWEPMETKRSTCNVDKPFGVPGGLAPCHPWKRQGRPQILSMLASCTNTRHKSTHIQPVDPFTKPREPPFKNQKPSQ